MKALSEMITSEKTKNCAISQQSIEKFLALMAIQQIEYSDITYKANGSSAIVFKAKKNNIIEVALKVLEYTDHTVQLIEAMEREFAMLKQLPFSDYFRIIYCQFFLTEPDQSVEQSQISNIGRKAYFVQEMEICKGNFEESIDWQSQKGKNPLSETFKELLAIQMLDAVNLLHQRQIAHGNITTQHFLVSSSQEYPILLKLCNLFYNYPCNSKNPVNSVTAKETQNSIPPQTELTKFCFDQDLVSLGKIFLLLDAIGINFDQSAIPNFKVTQFYPTTISESNQLNQNTTLFKIASLFLKQSKENSQSARSMLLLLLQKQTQTMKIPLFSAILKSQVDSLCLQIPLKSQILDYLLCKVNRDRKFNNITSQCNVKGLRKPELTMDLLRSALGIMLQWEEFSGEYDILGVGSGGVVFGVQNLQKERKSALKLSLCTNKSKKMREITIMSIFQAPNIVKFYGHRFFKDANNNEFVVYELERCKYSLIHHLELQRIQGEYSYEQKQLLTLQILNTISFLHENLILHRNIKLDSFFIIENESGQAVAKLSNFSHAVQLQELFEESEKLEKQIFEWKYESPVNCILNKHNGESPLYFAPERWENPDLSSYFTDSFSVGICIFLLDNYLVCSEEQFVRKLGSYPPGGSYEICKDLNLQINTKKSITRLSNQLFGFLPIQRTSLKNLIATFSQTLKQNKKKSKDLFKNPLQQDMMFKIENRKALSDLKQTPMKFTNLCSISLNLEDKSIGDTQAKSLLSPLSTFLNLTNLNINLSSNSIGDIGAKYLLSPLANLLNLSSLTLNIQCNQIREKAAEILLCPLANLLSLSNLALNLSSNLIGDIGAKHLLSPIANLINLSRLALTIDNNSIEEIGGVHLLSPLGNLFNLQSLALNLNSNQIKEIGAKSLLSPLTNLLDLSILTLNLYENSIGDAGAQSLLVPLDSFRNLSSLSLNLEMNQIGEIGAKQLLSPLANLLDLSSLTLHLDGNQIGDKGAEFLLFPLSNLLNLSSLTLNLKLNVIGEIIVEPLLSPLANLFNLSRLELNMGFNSIEVSGAGSLLYPLRNLVNLKSILLIIENNEIGDIGIQSLLSPLRNIVNLSTISLNLSTTQISDIGAYSLFYLLSNMLSLSSLVLQLSDNFITKQIRHLCKRYLKNLQFLTIDY